MIMPIKYTEAQLAEAATLRAAGEKMVVLEATFGPGIGGALRRVRERAEGGKLLARIKSLRQATLVRKSDGQRYQVFRAEGRHIGGRAAAYLVPIWKGNSHWKTHERILLDFTDSSGASL